MLSVVIPAYNEQGRLPGTVDQVIAYLDGRGEPYEVILVDDGSSDGTLEYMNSRAAQSPGSVKVVALPGNRGKGRAVAEGVAAAAGDLVLFSDADLSTPIEEVEKLQAALAAGSDVAIASRAKKGAEIVISQPAFRVLMGKVFNLLVQGLGLVPGIWDTQCGFKLFGGDDAKALFGALRTDGFAFDVEILHRARRRHLKIREVPVRWLHSAPTKVALSSPLEMFIDLLRIRVRR